MAQTYLAVQCTKLSKSFEEGIHSLQITTLQRKPLGKNEIRIKIHACSLNYFDLLMLVDRYQFKPTIPFTVASEGSGEVIEVGSAVKQHKVGDQVLVGMSLGMMAQEAIVNSMMAIPKPKNLTYEEASGLFVGYTTAYHGLVQRGNLKEGEFLLVTGAAGGMGAAAVQLGKALGAKVIACASTTKKLEAVKRLGADFLIDYTKEDMKQAVDKITDGKYVDVIYECVGGDIFAKCVRCIGDQGRLLVIGFASGVIPDLKMNMPLVKGFSVVGVRAGESMRRQPAVAMEMFSRVDELAATGKITPHVEKRFDMNMASVQDAFKLLANREAIGKIVVSPQKTSGSASASKL
eukprot:TRINITY_DN5103_c0_g1_i2.p1 TRINITY_DN5103_c0_g1~~TRINITY_DN5103_c0_g1_i2.p1  ORF type:complete len:348 (+),score=92.83 TRINITY_DN5103_c0_g1_i2:45-1088(+)